MIALDDYLADTQRSPWVWGECDCCFFAGNWIRVKTGKDALSPYRGQYHSAAGARRLIGRLGGLPAMVAAEMARCGFAETGSPDHGDIAVVDTGAADRLAVSGYSVVVRCGPWWIGRAIDGLVGFDMGPVKSWRIS